MESSNAATTSTNAEPTHEQVPHTHGDDDSDFGMSSPTGSVGDKDEDDDDEPQATTNAEAGPSTNPSNNQPDYPISKNAQKRILKMARRAELKVQRKIKDKIKKKEKKRVLAEKRKAEEEEAAALAALQPPPSKKQKKNPQPPPKKVRRYFNARIVIDLGFDQLMKEKEINSLCAQLNYAYGTNKRAEYAFKDILCTGLDSRTKAWLDKVGDRSYLRWRGVDFWTGSYEALWNGEDPGTLKLPPPPVESSSEGTEAEERRVEAAVVPGPSQPKPKDQPAVFQISKVHKAEKDTVVYLTADSENELKELKEGETYIIGGIVDRNRYKNLCKGKAEGQGVRTARLPIGSYIAQLPTRKVLTVNQVFQILAEWVEHRDWEKAFLTVIPRRKFKDGKTYDIPPDPDPEHPDEGEEIDGEAVEAGGLGWAQAEF